MSHCAPEATLKPKRFEFTLKTTDVFVTEVYWEAVPKTWPGDSFCRQIYVRHCWYVWWEIEDVAYFTRQGMVVW